MNVNDAIDALERDARDAIGSLERAIAKMKDCRQVASAPPMTRAHEDNRAISIAITEAETALLWVRTVLRS